MESISRIIWGLGLIATLSGNTINAQLAPENPKAPVVTFKPSKDAPSVATDTVTGLTDWLARFQQITFRMKSQEYVNMVDWAALVETCTSTAESEFSDEQKERLTSAFMVIFGRMMPQLRDFFAFSKAEIRNVELNDNDAAVVARTWDLDGLEFKLRWWLRKDGDLWRMTDFENLTMGMRLSVLVSMGLNVGSKGEKLPPNTAAKFFQFGAAAEEGDFELTLSLTNELLQLPFPTHFVEYLKLVQYEIHNELGNEGEAHEILDELRQAKCSNPLFYLSMANEHYLDGRHNPCLKWLEKYAGSVGHDSDSWPVYVEMLCESNRDEDALRAASEWVEDYPNAPDGIYAYWSLLPESDRERIIRPALSNMDGPEESLPLFGFEAEFAEDAAALRLAIDVMKARGLDSEIVAEWNATLAGLLEQRDSQKKAGEKTQN